MMKCPIAPCASLLLGSLLVACGGAGLAQPQAGYVWWEGEATEATNFPKRSWFAASTFEASRHDILSGGDWLSNSGERERSEAFARYRIAVPASGEYALWARKFWKHGPFRWRFDEREWRVCGEDVGLADSVPIRKHLCVNWVFLGKVQLEKGAHDFELRLLARVGESLTACFDCFLLTRATFVPRGKLKPGEASGKQRAGWWALEPEPDAFADALVDLRALNEKAAGEGGFVRRQGDDFVLGSGKSVRFWGVNLGPAVLDLGEDALVYLARRLAKVGVNMVRFHGAIFDAGAKDPAQVDRTRLARLHFLCSALKSEGIYLTLSFYFPLWFEIRPEYGIPGYEGIRNKKPFSLLFFDPTMQGIYRAWLKVLLTEKNPHTGLPLARDPAVAIIELVNEDSYFFWTFKPGETIPAVQMAKLEKRFGDWLAQRHGSIPAALRAWGGAARRGDRPSAGRMELLAAWHMTAEGHRARKLQRRIEDQARFLTEDLRTFYMGMKTFIRKELESPSLIACGNWHTADPRLLDPLERYAYTAGDVIDSHGYFGGKHEGEGASYAVRVGHRYEDRAAVREPEEPPFLVNQVAGYPHTISEIGWPSPNRYQAELPFLCAAYGALQGIDGFDFFAVGVAGWSASVAKFPVSVPSILGQFPGCALLYRRGDVSTAEAVVHDALSLDDLFALKGQAVVAPQNLDALRGAGVPPGGVRRGAPDGGVDPLAFLVGPVQRSFEGRPERGFVRDLGGQVDRRAKVVRSLTGELHWDYGAGVVSVNTARAQGAGGFLGGRGDIRLQDVTLSLQNDFGNLLVISLDDRPIATSQRLLIQAATEEEPFGWRVEDGRIAHLGEGPMMVREVLGKIRFHRGKRFRSARVLDVHGYLLRQGKLVHDGEAAVVDLPRDALYTIVE